LGLKEDAQNLFPGFVTHLPYPRTAKQPV